MRLTLETIQADAAARRAEFPIVQERLFLAHAAASPLPARTVEAMCAYVRETARKGQFEHLHRRSETGARVLAAELLGVTAEEIAFIPSTSAGLGMIAAGLEWRPGDNVVVLEGDFPANLYPWLNLRSQGVQVRSIPADPPRTITWRDVTPMLDRRTRLATLPSVHYLTGMATDIRGIGAELRSRNILLCVDAIQSLGALPCPGSEVDFLVADGHKWLLGPQAMGLMMVRREAFSRLRPALVGWKSVAAPREYHSANLSFPDDARRYEPGSLNAVGLVGLHASLELLLEVGIAPIARHLACLRAALVEGLQARGYRIAGDPAPALPSGITTFQRPGRSMSDLCQWLDARNVVVSLRRDSQGGEWLRAAPHFYTTGEEIGLFLELLDAAEQALSRSPAGVTVSKTGKGTGNASTIG